MDRKEIRFFLVVSLLVAIIAAVITSCKDDNEDSHLEPIIATITPASGKAGDIIKISGKGFNPIASENIVTFNEVVATVQNATATELTVLVPARAGDGIVVVTTGVVEIIVSSFDYIESPFVSTLAGSTVGFADGADALFNGPSSLAVDVAGNIYVADTENHKIRKITPVGVVSTLAGSTSGYADGQGAAVQFNRPFGIALDAEGNIYVADTGNHRIRKITATGIVSTLAGGSNGFADGQGVDAQFTRPVGITTDAGGNIYVADFDNHKIRKITSAGFVSTLAGGIQGFANGQGDNAKFSFPTGIVVDYLGNAFVSDDNNVIRKITSDGVVSTFAGGTLGSEDGQSTEAQFNLPFGFATDDTGNIYVGDTGNVKIRKITSAGVVSTLAGSTSGYADLQGENAQFRSPRGVAIDANGNVYVADSENNRIRKIALE